ncbi:MAG TPA: hypothetical protein VED66_07100 [Candidatus Sulfotelmatobacter sp.]|nr:hypothetical protein [Candidatus Sulfotelmatobacter sp.]
MTDVLHSVLHVVLFAFCLLPALPLAWGWIEISRAKPRFDPFQVVLLTLVTASFAWIVLTPIFPLSLGPYHSDTRQLTVGCNLLVMTLVAVAAFIRKKRISPTLFAAGATALVWYYIAIINVPV